MDNVLITLKPADAKRRPYNHHFRIITTLCNINMSHHPNPLKDLDSSQSFSDFLVYLTHVAFGQLIFGLVILCFSNRIMVYVVPLFGCTQLTRYQAIGHCTEPLVTTTGGFIIIHSVNAVAMF